MTGKESTGSFVEPSEEETKSNPTLIDKLDELIKVLKNQNEIQKSKTSAIVKATEAMNALLTTLVGQTRTNTNIPTVKEIPQVVYKKEEIETPLPEPTPETQEMSNSEVVKGAFREDADLLIFEEEEDHIKVSPRQYLAKNFARIGAVVRELGGRYVSAGKESHFIIPNKQVEEDPYEPDEDVEDEITEKKEVTSKLTETTETVTRMENVRAFFPNDLTMLLTFNEDADYILIKPRQFLGSENFAKIASIVREIGGDYISAGKESHFRIPKKE